MRPTKNVDKKLLNIYYLAAPSSGSDSNAGSPEGCNDAIQAGDRSLELGSRSEANSVSPLPQKSGSLLSMTSQVFFYALLMVPTPIFLPGCLGVVKYTLQGPNPNGMFATSLTTS